MSYHENGKELFEIVYELIRRKREGDYWDYKERYHDNAAEFIHDIICMANNRSAHDAYIIYGVYDGAQLGEICGTENLEPRLEQKEIISRLQGPKWAGGIYPDVDLRTLQIDEHEIDVLIIKSTCDVPYYLVEDYTRGSKSNNKQRTVRSQYIYTRVLDTNTPIDKGASPSQVEHLWKMHFGLLSEPLEQMKEKLKRQMDWVEYNSDENWETIFYNKFSPEYTLRIFYSDQDEKDEEKAEFYAYNQTDTTVIYSTCELRYHTTVLSCIRLVSLDGARYKTPEPDWGYIHQQGHRSSVKYTYKYFLVNSLKYNLQQFFYDDTAEEQSIAKKAFDDVVLYFKDELEKECFEHVLEYSPEALCSYLSKAENSLIHQPEENEAKEYRNRLLTGFALNEFLNDMRHSGLPWQQV